MLKITRETDYALLIMTHLAKCNVAMSASQIANDCQISQSFTSKILKLLTREKLLTSIRGSQGGYLLERKADQISLLEIIIATEGPISINDCTGADPLCERSNECELTPHWLLINKIFHREFSQISLASLVELPSNFMKQEKIIPIPISRVTK